MRNLIDKHKSLCMTDDQLSYLTRSFERIRRDAVPTAKRDHQRILRQASAGGRLQSGHTLLAVKEQFEKILQEAAAKMVRQAFDIVGPDASNLVQAHIVALRGALSDSLAEFYRDARWASDLGECLGNEFHTNTDRLIEGLVDDLQHGFLEGTKLSKDPIVSVVSSITNSPGAVQQSGLGNVQENVLGANLERVRSTLKAFVSSSEVAGLPTEDRQGIIDVADVISSELDKPHPDPSKLARWGRRLSEIAEKFGIAVAASGVSRALFG